MFFSMRRSHSCPTPRAMRWTVLAPSMQPLRRLLRCSPLDVIALVAVSICAAGCGGDEKCVCTLLDDPSNQLCVDTATEGVDDLDSCEDSPHCKLEDGRCDD